MIAQIQRNRAESALLETGVRRRFFRASLGCALALALAAPAWAANTFNSVYISEFLAENRHTVQDSEGDYPGWIELCNGSSDVVNLAGWFLSDSPTNLTKWRFPAVFILPGTCLVIFASGKGRTSDLAHLHTSFRLDKNGGYLALAGPRTNVVCEFAPAYPGQSPDVSYGRVRGEPDIPGYFLQPTPGKHNDSSGAGFARIFAVSQLNGARSR